MLFCIIIHTLQKVNSKFYKKAVTTMNYFETSIEALENEKTACYEALNALAEKGLSLDLSRGKPSK